MPIDYAGNTLGTARGLNITPTTQTFTDWVGSLDTNDYYRFSLSSRSSFNLTLNGMSADADVRLLNSSGMTIGSSTCGGSLAESINSILDSGTYYIRVYPYSGSTNYNLNVSATAIADYAGNSMTTARNISLSSTTTTYSDLVGAVDTNDYYRFTLGSASNFNLSLNGMSADADVQFSLTFSRLVQSKSTRLWNYQHHKKLSG